MKADFTEASANSLEVKDARIAELERANEDMAHGSSAAAAVGIGGNRVSLTRETKAGTHRM